MSESYNKAQVIQGLPHNLVSNNKYLVRFAMAREELQQAQRLRFEVFNLELGEGLDSSYENRLDADRYDDQCHHLLVVERATDRVIGTYRMQTCEAARKGFGFYTGEEFGLDALPKQVIGNAVEVGRACIDKRHRNGRVLYLLWRGLAKYLSHTRSRFLFGCCSITSQDQITAWNVMEYLRRNGYLHPEFRVPVTPEFRCRKPGGAPGAGEGIQLPQLFRLYMDVGAKVCSPPAIDRQFKTIDYLVILDIEALDERTRMLFFK